jgi:hypothetical protein
LAQHSDEPKFKRLRCSNAAFQRKLGFPAAVKLLVLAGFAEKQLVWQQAASPAVQGGSQAAGAAGVPEPVLVYARHDPGLLWLVLSVVKDVEGSLVGGS